MLNSLSRESAAQVLYVPSAQRLIEGGTFQKGEDGLWETPEVAKDLLRSMVTNHKEQLADISTTSGQTLLQVCALVSFSFFFPTTLFSLPACFASVNIKPSLGCCFLNIHFCISGTVLHHFLHFAQNLRSLGVNLCLVRTTAGLIYKKIPRFLCVNLCLVRTMDWLIYRQTKCQIFRCKPMSCEDYGLADLQTTCQIFRYKPMSCEDYGLADLQPMKQDAKAPAWIIVSGLCIHAISGTDIHICKWQETCSSGKCSSAPVAPEMVSCSLSPHLDSSPVVMRFVA